MPKAPTTSKPGKSLRQRGLEYLARREYSRQELLQKLQPAVGEDDDLPALLDDFQKRGWLSEERFTEQIVHARTGRYGSLKVANELREKGVSEALVDQAIAQMTGDEERNARAVWQRKFGTPPSNRNEWAKQARFLQSRGFGFEIIKRVLNANPDESE
jgi:regulatory protein